MGLTPAGPGTAPGEAPGTAPVGGPPEAHGIYLYWIPLGAGGTGFVRLNGRIYEAFASRLAGRPAEALYHSALEVLVPKGRFVVENAWPSPDGATSSRGVVVEGPVFHRFLGRVRPFRYEVRCWRDGVIPDAAYAVESPVKVGEGGDALLRLVPTVPPMVWGRDEQGAGEMWNSNSVISWLLERSGVGAGGIAPPAGGRAPGWEAGRVAAAR